MLSTLRSNKKRECPTGLELLGFRARGPKAVRVTDVKHFVDAPVPFVAISTDGQYEHGVMDREGLRKAEREGFRLRYMNNPATALHWSHSNSTSLTLGSAARRVCWLVQWNNTDPLAACFLLDVLLGFLLLCSSQVKSRTLAGWIFILQFSMRFSLKSRHRAASGAVELHDNVQRLPEPEGIA